MSTISFNIDDILSAFKQFVSRMTSVNPIFYFVKFFLLWLC